MRTNQTPTYPVKTNMRRVYTVRSNRASRRRKRTWLLGLLVVLSLLAVNTYIGVSRSEQTYPPVGEFARIEGLRLHYKMVGTGPALVLIHGASTSLRDFDASILEPLSRSHRVIAIDRPGHGYSDRPPGDWPDPAKQARLIHALLKQLGVEEPLLVGHSWSGSLVLAFLLDFPADAAGGVLLAGGSHPWEGGVAWYNDLASLPVVGDLFAWTLAYPLGSLALDGAVARVFDPNTVPGDYKQRTGIRLSLRPKAFLANAQDISRLSDFLATQSRRYGDISRPLLMVTGGEDRIVPSWNHADRLVQQVVDAERVELEASGHALHHAYPTRVVDLIEAFSNRLRATPERAAVEAHARAAEPAVAGAHSRGPGARSTPTDAAMGIANGGSDVMARITLSRQ